MVEHLNKETFKEKIFDFENKKDWEYSGSLPTVIDFYADWCGPCQMLAPVMEELSKEYQGRVNVYKINTEEEQELAALFGVRSIPSILFVPAGGAKPQMSTGAMPKSGFARAFKEIFNIG